MNKSQWVYDLGGGGDYIEAAISSLGISDEQLLQNLAQRLSKKVKDTTTVSWPSRGRQRGMQVAVEAFDLAKNRLREKLLTLALPHSVWPP